MKAWTQKRWTDSAARFDAIVEHFALSGSTKDHRATRIKAKRIASLCRRMSKARSFSEARP